MCVCLSSMECKGEMEHKRSKSSIIKVVHITHAQYSTSSEVIWLFCGKNRLITKSQFFNYIIWHSFDMFYKRSCNILFVNQLFFWVGFFSFNPLIWLKMTAWVRLILSQVPLSDSLISDPITAVNNPSEKKRQHCSLFSTQSCCMALEQMGRMGQCYDTFMVGLHPLLSSIRDILIYLIFLILLLENAVYCIILLSVTCRGMHAV